MPPTTPEKRLLAAGAKKATTWGTAVALGAGDGILIDSDGGLARKQDYLAAKEADTPFVKEGDLGPVKEVDFSPTFFMRYDPGRLGTLIALLFGTAGTPTQQGATTAWKHVFQWADSVYGKFATFAVERPGKIWEVASAKVHGFELVVAAGLVKGTLNLRGNTVIDDSAVNTATQMDALTYVDRENRIRFTQGQVKMNAQTGEDVTGETALQINSLSISYKRSVDAVVPGGETKIIEPVENDHPIVQVKLGFPRMNSVNAAFFSTFSAETEQKMLIKFTGALIATSYYYDLALYFPRLRIIEPDFPWDEVVPGSITLQAEEASTNPTGMSYARPYAELINKQTTDYLA